MEVYKQIKQEMLLIVMILTALQLAWAILPIGRDDTDGASRSGMKLRTDAKTGCQYLEAQSGGLTPRLDQNGKHICGGL